MTVFVLVVVMFLTGGQLITQAMAVSPGATAEDCRLLGADVVGKLQGETMKDDSGTSVTILDAQATCVMFTKQDHA